MFQNNNTNLYPNLSGAPQNDVFEKSSSNPINNVSFGGPYKEEKYESYASKLIENAKLETDYHKKFAAEVQKKMDEVWEWTSKRPRYQSYFKKLKIEKPKLIFVSSKDNPDSSNNRYLSYDKGAPTRYNWINNTIIVDIDYFPNVILASQGKIALTPQAVAKDFIRRHDEPDEEYEGYAVYEEFEDLGKRSLEFALIESEDSGVSFYSLLSAKEAAELAPAFLAHELEHTVAMHVILNTAGINMQRLKDAFNDLNDADILPPQTSEHWKHSYPYKYRKQLSAMEFGKDDVWKIRDDSGNSLRRLSHHELLNEFFADAGSLQNLLELDARYASLSYLGKQQLSGFSETSQERINLALDFQEKIIKDDIDNRLSWTNLTRAAKRVRGKKPASSTKKSAKTGKK